MGAQEGTAAPAFATHESYYKQMGKIHDILLVENVPEYDTDIPQQHLDQLRDDGEERGMWGSVCAVVDPRIFGVPAARARLFYLAFRKDRVKLRTDVCLDCIGGSCLLIHEIQLGWSCVAPAKDPRRDHWDPNS